MTKLTVRLDDDVARALCRRALELGKPVSRYLADLVEADVRRHRDALAAEGYRLLSPSTLDFAEAALPLAMETWPP